MNTVPGEVELGALSFTFPKFSLFTYFICVRKDDLALIYSVKEDVTRSIKCSLELIFYF